MRRYLLPLLAFGFAALSTSRAQSVLFAQYKDQMYPVISARGTRPCVQVDGKLVVTSANTFALRHRDEFFPAFISVRRMRARTTYIEFINDASEMNHNFEFKGEFESPYRLEDVFLVLELDLDRVGKTLFVYEIGRMEPRHPKNLNLAIPIAGALGEGRYQLHLFVGGNETFHSEQPFAAREAAFDRMIAKRVEKATDGAPKPFSGPLPEYPPELLKAKHKGHVLLRLHIRPNGAVVDPAVIEATEPAFGESALTAVRLWRFLPKIKDGHPVDTIATIPIEFVPPEKSPAKS